jgi:hypothetical protein
MKEGEGRGSFDAKTRAALQKFQRLNNLYPFGELGLQTQQALDRGLLRAAPDLKSLPRATFILGVDGVIIGGLSSENSWTDSREVPSLVPELISFERFPFPSDKPGSVLAKRSSLRETGTIVAPDLEELVCEWSSRIFPFASSAKGASEVAISPVQGITVIGGGNYLPRPCTTMPASAFPAAKRFQSLIAEKGMGGGPKINRLWKVDVNGDKTEDWILETLRAPKASAAFPLTEQLFDIMVYFSGSKGAEGVFALLFMDSRISFNDSLGPRISTRFRSLLDADVDGTYEDPIGGHGWKGSILMKLEGNKWREVLREGCGD